MKKNILKLTFALLILNLPFLNLEKALADDLQEKKEQTTSVDENKTEDTTQTVQEERVYREPFHVVGNLESKY